MKNLNALYQECKTELDSLHIPYAKNVLIGICNSTAYTGQTQRERNHILGKWDYSIKISRVILGDETLVKGVKQTIIHELLHTCPDCWNHKDKWKKYAELVNNKLGYRVSRCTRWEDYGLKRDNVKAYKYRLHCVDCGSQWFYTRCSKMVQYTDYYRCKCGGRIVRDF